MQKGFSADWLYQLKQKNNIVSIIGRSVHLEKKGGKYWGCCPFHNEKTPSFTVNEDDGLFYCFGCKESGDVISFIQKYESCDFYEAVKILAKNAGMEVPEYSGDEQVIAKKQNKERLLKLLDETYKHYQANLYTKEAKPAQEYIKTRGFTRRELEDFRIGYSLGWNELVNHLKAKGYTFKEMLDAGVVQCKNNHYYDAMAERLVFPIFNSFDECIGFSARSLVPTDFAKYKNTAETAVFQKGRVVFGINLVKKLKQTSGIDKIIIVEGQIDVIAMHRAGFKSTVACMGTALTKENAHELKKISNNIVLCFDGDGAGIKATIRSIDILNQEGFNTTIVSLPDGHDPDEILKLHGKEYLASLIDKALPVTDFLIENELKHYDLTSASQKGKFANAVLTFIAKLETSAEQEPYLDKIYQITNIPVDVLRRDLQKLNSGQVSKKVQEEKEEESVLTARENGNIRAVKFILASLIHQKEFVNKKIDYKKLMPRYSQIIDKASEGIKISSYFDYFNVDEEPVLKDCINMDFSQYEESGKRYFDECLWLIASGQLLEKQAQLAEKFKDCSQSEERVSIAEQISEISKELREKNLEEFYVR